jgi:hypothetical protein
MPRDAEGKLVYPAVITRKPRAGDVHPLPKSWFVAKFNCIPPEYVHGLRRIELLPRPADVGSPFGKYLFSEKRVVLYSLPRVWETQLIPRWRERRAAD